MGCKEYSPQLLTHVWRTWGRPPAAGVCGSDGVSVRSAWKRSEVKREAAVGCGMVGGCEEGASIEKTG